MQFEAVPLAEAEGHILGHNIAGAEGRRALRKGKALTAKDIAVLRDLGLRRVWIARLDPGDIEEDPAAARIAHAVAGDGIRLSKARTGRVNLYASTAGLLRLDLDRLAAVNGCEGVTLATLLRHTVVRSGKMVATLKIIPYAVPATTVRQAEQVAGGATQVVRLTPFAPRRAGLILSAAPAARERVVSSFRDALGPRLQALGASLDHVDFVPLEDEDAEERLATAITTALDDAPPGLDLLVLAGETAIMDRHDIAPRSVERAGGTVEIFGAPVDPGNLLLLAYRGGIPIVGGPGCSRSPKANIIDLVLPRLLAGDRLGRADILAFGHGGLLEDVPERPLPRSWLT